MQAHATVERAGQPEGAAQISDLAQGLAYALREAAAWWGPGLAKG